MRQFLGKCMLLWLLAAFIEVQFGLSFHAHHFPYALNSRGFSISKTATFCMSAEGFSDPTSTSASKFNSRESLDRQTFLKVVGTSTVALGLATSSVNAASEPVLVLGAGGKTGKECIFSLNKRGVPCIAASRGDLSLEVPKPELVTFTKANVINPDSLAEVIKPGVGAVIFAASASKKGGSAKEVDYEGVVNVAKACIAAEVPRLVVVSSGGVSKPDSAVYKFLNLFGEIMKYKILGEDTLRSMYAEAKNDNIGYTIVRPGGLTEDQSLGVSSIELNQGDTKSGRIARADVAEICVESIFSKAARDTTFECYYANTAKPLDNVGISNIMKRKTTEAEVIVTGREQRGETWSSLFSGLKSDF